MTWVIRNGPMIWPKDRGMRHISRGWRGFWKVTAAYLVHVTKTKRLKVFRVTSDVAAGGCTLHLSERELNRQFDLRRRYR